MNERIYFFRGAIKTIEADIAGTRTELKALRTNLKAAQRSLFAAIDDEANGVQELPLGDPQPKSRKRSKSRA